MALLQDALELGDPVGAGPLEGNLVGDADDLHGAGVTCYLAVGDRHHVIETQGLRCKYERGKKKNVRYWIAAPSPTFHFISNQAYLIQLLGTFYFSPGTAAT